MKYRLGDICTITKGDTGIMKAIPGPSPHVNNSFKELMVGFNSPSITNEQFENSLFPLPPLPEQTLIVAEIEKQLAKTKQLNEHNITSLQTTEQLLKSLLHEVFEVE